MMLDEGFGDFVDVDCGLYVCCDVCFFESVLECQVVDYGGQYVYVVVGYMVDIVVVCGNIVDDVVVVDDDGDFDVEIVNFVYFLCD